MFTLTVLPIILILMPGDNRENEQIKARLVGTWRMVATEEEGKVKKVEQPGPKIVITTSTMSLFFGEEVIWQANYRIDASKRPALMVQQVTRAPCLSGSADELKEIIRFDGDTLIIGTMHMKKIGR